ncbi:hypothetical protein [Zeaxanthinibacter enoshimensis]|uniref:Membrane metalloprotease n=1 Tax=Zeaxanthinibacter enoshimensis TaxID=392009 RepID=A0A4R6TIG5_9FLAO|nr:hypothetical protein [Zeaxanthinibacter enoshimensis]TDQ29050.1 hypothetical protein CLV82_2499 [Zeaxanthinibacter enoshimensis]
MFRSLKNFNKLAWVILILVMACSKSSNQDGVPMQTVDPEPVIDKTANLKATGASANDILSNAEFDNLLIEVAYVEGFKPTDEAMANFVSFLQERTFKQNITVEYLSLPSPGEENLTTQEIADLESENRTAYNSGNTLAIYIYFADVPSEGDEEEEGRVTLGAVYRNTSMVIFEQTIRNLAARSAFISNADLETATLHHEFGHLFGLVNLGTEMVNDHEDPDAGSHCVTDGCLMRAELQFGNAMAKMLQSRASKGLAAVPELDNECLLDLQANGGR